MAIKEFEYVVLDEDLANSPLRRGDLGIVVMVHNNGEAYEVEFTALDGKTVSVETLEKSQIRSIRSNEIANVRELV